MNNKAFSKIWIAVILVVLIAGGFLTWQYLGGTKEKVGEKSKSKSGEIAQELKYPEEYLIYQDYLGTIGGVPRVSDVGIIEGTVISITRSEACPYPEEKCRIEPYPKDIGIVRIDKIIEYTSYSEQSVGQPIEEPPGEEPSGEEPLTGGGNKGEEPPLPPKPIEYERLQVGQEVPTSFLLTTRPVKVRYVSIPPTGEPEPGPHGALELETGQSAEEPVGEKSSVEYPLEPGEEPLPKTYKPIPREGKYFVFTTKIIGYPETSQKILPGLEIGSKFRAKIHYAGSLYVEEYEIVP